jgi:hypothetical protein
MCVFWIADVFVIIYGRCVCYMNIMETQYHAVGTIPKSNIKIVDKGNRYP